MKYIALLFCLTISIIPSCKSDTGNDISAPNAGEGTYLSIQSPNGGESITVGENYTIRWSTDASNPVNIKYTSDNGSEWKLIKAGAENRGTFEWNPVPSIPSDYCKVKISTADGNLSDESDTSFRIVRLQEESISLLSPIGGERWPAGSKQTIKWASSGIESVKIEYSTDSGINWHLVQLVNNVVTSYLWNPVTASVSSNALIRISDSRDGYPSAQSSSCFTISPEEKIRVVYPSGGSVLNAGLEGIIRWESENIEVVSISYSSDGGINWNVIASAIPSNGTFFWQNIPDINSSNCLLKIWDYSDGDPEVLSDGLFSITRDQVKSIQVIQPGDGDSFCKGDTIKTRWNSVNVSAVSIHLTTNNGITWNEITNSLANTGNYEFIAPEAVSILCKIRVSESSNPSINGESAGLFKLMGERKIILNYPTEGETIYAGDNTAILWNSSNVKYFNIDYSYESGDEGRRWIRIAAKLETTGAYITVLNHISDNCKIRISDWERNSIYSENKGTFRVISR